MDLADIKMHKTTLFTIEFNTNSAARTRKHYPAPLKFTVPGEVCSVQLLQVTGRCRVEHVDFVAICLPGIYIVDQLVQVLVPQVGILILKV